MDIQELRTQRTAELHQLRTTDPVAWCICIKSRGAKAIAECLAFTLEEVETELKRLRKAKAITKRTYMGQSIWAPENRELKRLARRAQNIKYNNRKVLELR